MYSVNINDVIQEVINTLNLSACDAEQLYNDINAGNAIKWLDAIDAKGNANLVERYKIATNIIKEPDEYDNYPTEQKYFVYDKDDNCVSSYGFNFEDGAIAFANSCGHPIVKIHRYYRDPTRGYKLYPDGYPETVWAYGKPVKKGE